MDQARIHKNIKSDSSLWILQDSTTTKEGVNININNNNSRGNRGGRLELAHKDEEEEPF